MDQQPSATTREEPVQDAPKLTDRQQQILDLIQSAIERTGAPPTRLPRGLTTSQTQVRVTPAGQARG